MTDPGEIQLVCELLSRYGEDEARNPESSQLLVNSLRYDNAAIRYLAFENVYRLTGRRYGFTPMGLSDRRIVAVDSWESHLERNGGTLLK